MESLIIFNTAFILGYISNLAIIAFILGKLDKLDQLNKSSDIYVNKVLFLLLIILSITILLLIRFITYQIKQLRIEIYMNKLQENTLPITNETFIKENNNLFKIKNV